MSVELNWMDWIQSHFLGSFLDGIMLFFTHIGDYGIIWIALTIGLLAFRKTRTIGLSMLIALILMLVINNGILKTMIARARPCQINQTARLLIDCPHSYSFPSGHTSSSFAALGIVLLTREIKLYWKWLVGMTAFLISFSRIYLYVHYPSDVLIGAIVGLVIAWVTIIWIMPRVLKGKQDEHYPSNI